MNKKVNLPADSSGLVRLIHVFDAGFVDQQVWPVLPIDLQATLVIPFDDTLNGLAIFQYDHHRRLPLHLLHVVEAFSMRLIRWNRLLLVPARVHLFLDLIQVRAN